ncbi:hypothetical protein QEN19_004073 [Hanseniaspora menglaensis]
MARRSNKNKNVSEEHEHKKEEYLSSASSSSEEEDDHGDLINEKVDDDIANVLSLLKNNEIDKLLNKENEFFKDEHFKVEKKEVDKPLYLKDYQRDLLLKQNENHNNDEKPFKTYQEEQDDQKKEILDEINAELSDKNNSDDDDFFVKKDKKTSIKHITDVLPTIKDDDSDEEKKDDFLNQFLNKQAWIPKTINEKGEITVARETDAMPEIIPLQDDDDEEFENAAEQFENAYNFRYEDPNSIEVVSYARQQATLRREQVSSRQKKRLAAKEEKAKESSKMNQEVNKTVTKMSKQMKDIVVAIEKEYGKKIDDKMVSKLSDLLITGDFDMNDWDGLVGELFNEDFYNEAGEQEIPEGMEGEYAEEEQAEENLEEPVSETKKLSKKKQKQLEKDLAKKNSAKLENIIDSTLESKKLNIIDTIKAPEERGRSKKQDEEVKFKYREVSPNSFGLELREIFLADDENLNEFMPIRNFTNYKKKEEIQRERKKMLKNGRRLKTWREKHPLNFDMEEAVTEDNRDKKKQKKSKK